MCVIIIILRFGAHSMIILSFHKCGSIAAGLWKDGRIDVGKTAKEAGRKEYDHPSIWDLSWTPAVLGM